MSKFLRLLPLTILPLTIAANVTHPTWARQQQIPERRETETPESTNALNTATGEEQNEEQINIAIESLVSATSDPVEEIRMLAFDALLNFGSPNEILIGAIREGILNEESSIRQQWLKILSTRQWPSEILAGLWLELVQSEDIERVREASGHLRRQMIPELTPPILKLVAEVNSRNANTGNQPQKRDPEQDSQPQESLICLYLVAIQNDTDSFDEIFSAVESCYTTADIELQKWLLEYLGRFGKQANSALPFVTQQAENSDPQIRKRAVLAIHSIVIPRARPSRRSRSSTLSRHSESNQEKFRLYANGVIKRYDSNENGILDGEEMRNIPSRLLTDHNDDGKIDADEIIQSITSRRD